MDVMIAAPPSKSRRIDPAPDLEPELFRLCVQPHLALFRNGFGTSLKNNAVWAIGQSKLLPVGPIDLWMKTEVGRQPLDRRGVNAPCTIANFECSGGRRAQLLENTPGNLPRRLAG